MTFRMQGQDPDDVTQLRPPSPADRLAELRALAAEAGRRATDAQQHADNAAGHAVTAVRHADEARDLAKRQQRRTRVNLALACIGAVLGALALACQLLRWLW